MSKKRALVSWSSGKDSAWTLHMLRRSGDHEIAGLLTTINSEFERVAMHGTRVSVLEAQAKTAGVPLWQVPLPWPCSNEHYESAMTAAISRAKQEHIEVIAFGDLFLEDIRAYREKQMEGTGIAPIFPLWMRDTRELAQEMIAAGLRTKITCVDPKHLDRSFAGREFDEQMLRDLPEAVDPCGERGEFHTCVYAGPMFSREVPLVPGEIVERSGFVYADFEIK